MAEAEQHDAHCILTRGGDVWRIRWVDRAVIGLWRAASVATVDARRIDWDSYCRAAAQLLEARDD